MELKTEDSSAFNAVIKLVLAKGVRNFFIMAGKDAPDLDERLGYCGAGLMLYAQTLGQQFLSDIGVVGEWEGIGHCAVGYVDGEIPKAAERKDGRVFWVE